MKTHFMTVRHPVEGKHEDILVEAHTASNAWKIQKLIVHGINKAMQEGRYLEEFSDVPEGQIPVLAKGKLGNPHRLYFVSPIPEEEKNLLEKAATLKDLAELKLRRRH